MASGGSFTSGSEATVKVKSSKSSKFSSIKNEEIGKVLDEVNVEDEEEKSNDEESKDTDDDSIRAASAIRAGYSSYSELERELRKISMCINVKACAGDRAARHRSIMDREVQTSCVTDFDEIEDPKVDKSTCSNDDNLLDCLIQKWTYKKYFRSVKAQTDNEVTGSSYSVEVKEEDSNSGSDEMNKELEKLSTTTKKTTATGSSEEELLRYKFLSLFYSQFSGTNQEKVVDEGIKSDEGKFLRRWKCSDKSGSIGSITSLSNRTRSNTYSSPKSLPRFTSALGRSAARPKPVYGPDVLKLAQCSGKKEWREKFLSLSSDLHFLQKRIEQILKDVVSLHKFSKELLNSLNQTSLALHYVVDNVKERIRRTDENICFIKDYQLEIHENLINIKKFLTVNEEKMRKVFQ